MFLCLLSGQMKTKMLYVFVNLLMLTGAASDVQQLTVSLLLTTPSQKELDNSGTASLVCIASNFYAKTHNFTWTRGSDDLSGKVKETLLSQDTKNMYNAVSVLEISVREWMEKTEPIQCKFTHNSFVLMKETVYAQGEITGPEVKIIPPSPMDILIKGIGNLVCLVISKSGDFQGITWKIGYRQIPSRLEGTLNKDYMIKCIIRISFDEWSRGTKFTCEVTHSDLVIGFQTVHYQRQTGPKECPKVYLLPPPESDNSGNVTLTCYAKDFYPKEVAVIWLVNDKLRVDLEHYTTSVIDRGNQFSVYSQLIFTKTEWESGAVVTCRVYHESIEDAEDSEDSRSKRFISRSIST